MDDKSFLSIGEFARLTGIKRANLIFYDQIGLLKPEKRGVNEYRYYSRKQLDTAYLIGSLRDLGIGLKEIKSYADSRTPEGMLTLFEKQEQRINAEIEKLHRLQEIMHLYSTMAKEAMQCRQNELRVVFQKREPIFLGQSLAIDYPEDDGMIDFYEYAAKANIQLGYPLGATFPWQYSENSQGFPSLKYYFRVKHEQNAYKPAGTYLCAYGQCPLGQPKSVFLLLQEEVVRRKYQVCGDVYVEYLLNEMAVKDENSHWAKVQVQIVPPDTL